jgi:hypothetical protein
MLHRRITVAAELEKNTLKGKHCSLKLGNMEKMGVCDLNEKRQEGKTTNVIKAEKFQKHMM